jgi:lysozyme
VLIASEGIDVSSAQHPASIDWARVRAEGISWVYCKAREGTTDHDSAFDAHVRAAHGARLLVGAYLFFHPMTSSIRDCADRFVEQIDPYLLELPPALDIETLCAGPGCKGHKTPATPVQLVDRAVEWCERVTSQLGRAPIVYIGDGLTATCRDAGANLAALARYPLWDAEYRHTETIQAPWTDVAAWQWTDGGQTGPRQLTAGLQLDRSRSPLTARDLAALGLAVEPRCVAPEITADRIALSDPTTRNP